MKNGYIKDALLCVPFVLAAALFFAINCQCRGDDQQKQPSIGLDSLILNDPISVSPEEFSQSLQRHFPVKELIRGNVKRETLSRVKLALEQATHHATAKIFEGRVNTGGAMCGYLSVVLKPSCSKAERILFCQFVDAMLKLSVEEKDDDVYRTYLSTIFADAWTGWGRGSEKWPNVKTALDAWHSTEIYKYLYFGIPPVSQRLMEKIELISKNEQELTR